MTHGMQSFLKEMKITLAYYHLNEILKRSNIIPSYPTDCDIAIPLINPLLLQDTVIATNDQKAYEFWRENIPSVRGLEVFKVELEPERDPSKLVYAILLLHWLIMKRNES